MFETTKDTWSDVFQGKEPLCLLVTNNTDTLTDELMVCLGENTYPVPHLSFDKMYVEQADQLNQILAVNTEIEHIVIDSSVSTGQAWDKLLKALDAKQYTPKIYIVGDNVPQAIWTRAAKYYFNYNIEDTELGIGDENFKVVSWLDGVESHSKDLLYGAADNWTPTHTLMLIDELDKQLVNESNFGFKLTRLRKQDISDCLTVLSSNESSMSVVLLLGLSLI